MFPEEPTATNTPEPEEEEVVSSVVVVVLSVVVVVVPELVVEDELSLLGEHEIIVKLKRNTERIMSVCLIRFPNWLVNENLTYTKFWGILQE